MGTSKAVSLVAGDRKIVILRGQFWVTHPSVAVGLRGAACHRSAKASGGEELQVEEPVACGDFAGSVANSQKQESSHSPGLSGRLMRL